MIYNDIGDMMKIHGNESNEIIIKEIADRIRARRIALSITQQELSDQSGISLRTINNVENGENITLNYLISILKVLKLTENLELLVPEEKVDPFAIIELGHKRKRAKKKRTVTKNTWKWGDEQ